MALTANAIVWELRTAGDDLNGGAFKTGASGTDYSQQDAKNTVGNNISTTDAVSAGTTTITSATAAFTSAIVGNVIYIAGGTGGLTGRWFEVTAFTNSTTITIDRATSGASTGCTLNIGGALKTIGGLGAIWDVTGQYIAGQIAWVKAGGTFTITNAGTNVATGRLINNMGHSAICGYNTTRGDNPTGTNRPLIQISSATGTYQIDFFGNGPNFISNIRIDGNGISCSAIRIDGGCYNVKVSGLSGGTGFTGANSNVYTNNCIDCESSSHTSGGIGYDSVSTVNCLAKSNASHGYQGNAGFSHTNSLAVSNTGSGFSETGGNRYNGCVSYGNTSNGFTSTTTLNTVNCIAEANGAKGFNESGGAGYFNGISFYNATYNNTTGATSLNTGTLVIGAITGSGSFFTNAASGDFSLNNTASAGALLRGTGYGIFPDGLTISYPDVGAAQVAAAAPSTPGHNFSASFG